MIAYGALNWVEEADPRLVEKVSPVGGLDCTYTIFGDFGTDKICWCKNPPIDNYGTIMFTEFEQGA